MNQDCQFCEVEHDFSIIMRKALYEKYSSSQNYTYLKIVNDLIYARRSHVTTVFKDFLYWDFEDEYLEEYVQQPHPLLLAIVGQMKVPDAQSQKQFAARLFHQSVARTIEHYFEAHEALKHQRHRRSVKTCSVSKILKTSMLEVQKPNNSVSGSIFFIKNQLVEIVSNCSVSYVHQPMPELSKQLRHIYQKFIQRRIETKMRSLQSNRRSLAHSADKQTQTTEVPQHFPVIKLTDKLFLQRIIRQQKEKDRGPLVKKYQNKLADSQRNSRTQRTRNSVEIHNNHSKYVSAFQSSNASTARLQHSAQPKSGRLSSTVRQHRTKSQSYDSNNVTKALESKLQQYNQNSEQKPKRNHFR